MGMFMERGIMAFADGKSLVSYGLNGYTEKETERLSGSQKIEIAQTTAITLYASGNKSLSLKTMRKKKKK
jgi:hypothetical protein